MYGTGQLSVVVAVLTYQRPEDLELAVPRLLEQAASAMLKTSVMVIDNDPNGSGRQIVGSFAASNLLYFNEPHPGISAARNRALAEAANFDLLVFIDDDEVPVENWLNLLLEQYLASNPAAIAGPVLSEYAHEPSVWIKEGEFFKRRRMASGSSLTVAATNNLLLDMRQIRSLELTFDERFGLSGGSDTLFTRQLLKQGGHMVWCDEAIVIDRVPASRLTRDWVLRRALRSGNSWSRVEIELADGPRQHLATRTGLAFHGGVRMAGGAARFLMGLTLQATDHRAKGLRTTARGLGMLSGAFGYVYSEYRRK
ncbi:glycosyltransferase family 2 protein [Arthrobacter sp. GMC3]|uniref:glycosyltransferase family 2 protein n=1 Tax=Arthrobacter sp. GMC3 TaxID=2058894 RepID=UPI000CE5061E|nr:glycosyltransferase family 2 protein [Arthrobacter sp. GMC3]